jgi:hypothetical protein
MRRFAIGSMVRQEMFKSHFEDGAIFRYGIVIEEISMEDMPYQKGLYFKILWQPSDSYAVSRNRSYTDYVDGERLELVSGAKPIPVKNLNAKGRSSKV